MKIVKSIFLLSFTLMALGSCKKYTDGPALSLRSKKARLCQTWVTQYYSENGVDKTTDWNNTFQSAYISLNKDGNYSIYYKLLGNFDYNETGTWAFTANKLNVVYTRVTPSADQWDWHILRLTKKEFWISDVNSSGVLQELKMIPK